VKNLSFDQVNFYQLVVVISSVFAASSIDVGKIFGIILKTHFDVQNFLLTAWHVSLLPTKWELFKG